MYFKSESKQKAKSIIISIFCVIYYKLFGHITLPISEMQPHSWDWVVISLWGICPEGMENRNMPSCLRHIWGNSSILYESQGLCIHLLPSFCKLGTCRLNLAYNGFELLCSVLNKSLNLNAFKEGICSAVWHCWQDSCYLKPVHFYSLLPAWPLKA